METIQYCPGVLLYKDSFNYSEEIINYSINEGDWITYSDPVNDYKNIKNYKDYDFCQLNLSLDSPVEIFLMMKNINNLAKDYALKQGCNFSGISSLNILKYRNQQGFPKIIFDQLNDINRIFSAVVFLNDIPSGGEMIFNQFNLNIKPVKNSILFYPANYMYSYRVKYPSVDKYCLNIGFNY